MHGVKRRVKTSEEKERERKAAELKKIQQYSDLSAQILQKRKEGALDANLLTLTGKLLEHNPEFYTLWNIRRQIFLQFAQEKTAEELQQQYDGELKFCEQAIATNPKSYWVWLHREWITTRKVNCDWARELKLCGMLLDKDERNFHCWNYRRYAAKSAKATLQDEFAFTTKKIEQNFSNYSAWHNRSAVLPLIYQGDEAGFKHALDQEFDLVQNAFYTEPGDQSAWFYHRWLIDTTCGTPGTKPTEESRKILERELGRCQELLSVEPNSKWTLLTITLLMARLGGHAEEIAENLKKLVELDPDRSNYYKDVLVKYGVK